MSRRVLVGVGVAVVLFGVGGVFVAARRSSTTAASRTTTSPSDPDADSAATFARSLGPEAGAERGEPPLPRPRESAASFGVLTDRSDEELRAHLDRAALGARLTAALCGDGPTCEAVRTTLRDEQVTRLRVVSAAAWHEGPLDGGPLGREAAALPRVVAVDVVLPSSPRQLALRTAVASTAALAESVGGLVHDPVLARVERPAEFARRAITAPLEAPAFRPGLIDVQYETREAGLVRVVTAGLGRWGSPDVEVTRVPAAVKEQAAAVLLATAEFLANGAERGPFTVSFGELARAAGSDADRGDDGSAGDGSSVPAPVSIGLVSVAPEAGDPGDFLVRLEPAGGSGPLGVVELLEHFFGAGTAFAPDPRLLETQKSKAQAELPAALGRWAGPARGGSALLVRVPFSIPGDAGFESMWIEVTRVDDATVTGKLLDEPLGATDVSRGEEVRKPRAEVEAMRWSPSASH